MIASMVGLTGVLGLTSLLALHPGQPNARRQARSVLGIEKLVVHSDVLGEDRTILVRVPEAYGRSSGRYPVLYVLDGEYFTQQAVSAVQFLSELGYERGQHPIPEMIVVGVVNVDRDRDYTPTHAPSQGGGRLSFPTSGGAAAFTRFLERELVPFVDSAYRTTPHRVLSGWSLGGLFTVHTFLTSPKLFSRYLAISPSLWWDDSVDVKDTRRRLRDGDTLSSKRIVITLGALEGGDMDGAVRRDFVPLLAGQRRRSVNYTFVEIPGENHNHVPYKAYLDGLTALYADWMVPSAMLRQGTASVQAFFRDLSIRWGSPVSVPLSVYQTLSVTLPDIESALDAARLAVKEYPTESEAYSSLGRLQQMAGDTTAAVATLQRALQLELATPVPQSERLRAIRGRLRRLGSR